MAQVTAAIPHGTPHLRRCRLHPARHAAQLLLLGHRRLHFPVLDQEEELWLVEPPQLFNLVGPGPGSRPVYVVHLLCLFHAGHRAAKVVGEQRRQLDHGCAGHGRTGQSYDWAALWARVLVDYLMYSVSCIIVRS